MSVPVAVQPQDELVLPEGTIATPTSLELPEALRFNDWQRFGEALFRLQTVNQWWIAGWAAYGDRQYRRDYGPAIETLYARHSLHNMASVYRRVDAPARREHLSFSHHEVVMSLEPQLQAVWLDDALRQGWSRDELRAQIAELKGRAPAPPAFTIKAKGAELLDLCSRAADKLGVELRVFALQALEDRAREVLGE